MKKKGLFVTLFSCFLSLIIIVMFAIVYKDLEYFSKVLSLVAISIMLFICYLAYIDYKIEEACNEVNPIRDMENEIERLYKEHKGDITEIMDGFYSKFGVSPLNDTIFTSTINTIRDRGDFIWN